MRATPHRAIYHGSPARRHLRMIVREGGRRHHRAENDVELSKQLTPAMGEAGAHTVGFHPVAMAQHNAAYALAPQARIGRGDRFGDILKARIDAFRSVGAEDRRK